MKKLLGLLLNCLALCLCSAIGIGAGMYWMQTTQQKSTTPQIQQTGAFETSSVQNTPHLLRPPVASRPGQVSSIPTAPAHQMRAIEPVAFHTDFNTPEDVDKKTTVSLLVNEIPAGTLTPDENEESSSPDGIIFLTGEEFKHVSFKAILPGTAPEGIKKVSVQADGKELPLSDPKPVPDDENPGSIKNFTWPIPGQSFDKDKTQTLKVTIEFTGEKDKETFTFTVEKYLYLKSVQIQQNIGSSILLDKNDLKVPLNGPAYKLDVEVGGTGEKDYRLRLVNKDQSVDKTKSSSEFSSQENIQFDLTSVGTYTLIVSPENSTESHDTRTFIIDPTNDYFNPKIITLEDLNESPHFIYDLTTYLDKLAPYNLLGPKLTCTVQGTSDRNVRLKYRKVGTDKFDPFQTALQTFDPVTGEAKFTDISLPPGKYEIQAEDTWFKPNDPRAISVAKTVIVPDRTSTLVQKPVISSYQNQLYDSKHQFTNSDTPVNVFGDYLELFGSNVTTDSKPDFLIFNLVEGETSKLVPANQIIKVNPSWKSYDPWNVLLKITGGTGTKVLYLRTQKGENYALSQGFKIEMKSTDLTSPLTIPTSLQIAGQAPSSPGIYNINQTQFSFKFPTPFTKGLSDTQALFYTVNSAEPIAYCKYAADQEATLLKPLQNGVNLIYMKLAQGNQVSAVKSNQITVNIQSSPLKVKKIEPPKFGSTFNPPSIQNLKIYFSENNPLNYPTDNTKLAAFKNSFYLLPQNSDGSFQFGNYIYASEATTGEPTSRKIAFIPDQNSVVLTFKNLPTNNYQLVIEGQHVVDKFGNHLTGVEGGEPGSTYRKVLSDTKPPGSTPGETPATEKPKEKTPSVPVQVDLGKFVKYREYEKRPPQSGFNPSDKVVTRVARLYYYRDAHRVAQILNSEVKSLNQKGYHEAQIKAEQTRKSYETAVFNRQKQEQKAIDAAEELRKIEKQYRTQQQSVSSLIRRRARLESETATVERPQKTIDAEKADLEKQINQAQGFLSDLRVDISTKSNSMNTEDLSLKEFEFKESQLSADLFRDEVRAEKADLYSIAKGDPCSYDAVQQVTIKVIGEGLIHLRGPIKGVNIVRTMINQIDSPVGQVRIAMHTIQINGEDGKRMEIVADRIQKSIDQSRFLTVQSAQMLRKSIVAVASEVAISTCQDGIGYTQDQRDEKYLYAFFGQDFIEALREMDSEFLQSGNKLLSIHSMDTTSLASALFVLALAKNEIRQQILARFYASLETELPEDELQFLFQGGPTKANKHKHVKLLAPYAHFQSFKGFFDHEVIGTDTMTPIQREFVRLAQIFKARLTTERELNLHVMERAVIEQRGDDYEEELKAAKQREERAQCKLAEVQKDLEKSQLEVLDASKGLEVQINKLSEEYGKIHEEFNSFGTIFNDVINNVLITGIPKEMQNKPIDIGVLPPDVRFDLLNFMFPQGPKADPFVFNDYNVKLLMEFLSRNNNSSRMLGILSVPTENLTAQLNLDTRLGMKAFIERVKKTTGTFTYGGQTFQFKINNRYQFEVVGETALTSFNQATTDYKTRAEEAIRKLEWFNLDPAMERKLAQARDYLNNIQGTKSSSLQDIHRIAGAYMQIDTISQSISRALQDILSEFKHVILLQENPDPENIEKVAPAWNTVISKVDSELKKDNEFYRETSKSFTAVNTAFAEQAKSRLQFKFAQQNALDSRLALDHRKFLDMQIDQTEDRLIELIEGTRAHTANIDNYLKRIATALEDDFNSQFYYPAFKEARDASRYWNVTFGSMETSTILTNNRSLGKVAPKATIEFDLPKRQLAIIEGMNIADAAFQEYGALVNDPTFLAISSMNGGRKVNGDYSAGSDTIEKQELGQSCPQDFKFGSAFENLIPDPAIFKFETGTGFTVRPVIQPDGQAVVFDLNYLYRTNIREPVRADEKHLARVKEHFIDTDVQLGNYELREVSRFMISLKASRTANGVPLLSDVPGVGVLFRPTPSAESSLQQSQIMSQAVIFPTLFDLMGLRWAPAVADVGPLQLSNREFISKGRDRYLKNRVYDYAGSQVDQFLQIPKSERRSDLYRTQQTIPDVHPNGYMGQGLNMKRSQLQENFHPEQQNPAEQFIPESNMQEQVDPHRAIPVLPTVPRIPTTPAVEGPTSSTRPIRDPGLKPASWSPTSAASRSENQGQGRKGGSWISSPRRITKPNNQHTQTQSVKPAPARQAAPTPRNIQPAKPESPGLYKRSVSRFKSLFQND